MVNYTENSRMSNTFCGQFQYTFVLLLQNIKLFGFRIFRFCAYLMKVIPERRRAH